jgi:hypothetical protein
LLPSLRSLAHSSAAELVKLSELVVSDEFV